MMAKPSFAPVSSSPYVVSTGIAAKIPLHPMFHAREGVVEWQGSEWRKCSPPTRVSSEGGGSGVAGVGM